MKLQHNTIILLATTVMALSTSCHVPPSVLRDDIVRQKIELPTDEHAAFNNSINIRMLPVPEGTFVMGGQPGTSPKSLPSHRVKINRFYLSEKEITKGQFKLYLEQNGLEPEKHHVFSASMTSYAPTPNHPVCGVSWYDAVSFCQWLSKREGLVYRLPTEAEWEYACRAGTRTVFWWGNDLRYDYAKPKGWFTWNNGKDIKKAKGLLPSEYYGTNPVGSFYPNPWGFYDMTGNAREWVADWYDADYYKHSPNSNPTGPRFGTYRVLRGGDANNESEKLTAYGRSAQPPESIFSFNGFRIACEVDASNRNINIHGLPPVTKEEASADIPVPRTSQVRGDDPRLAFRLVHAMADVRWSTDFSFAGIPMGSDLFIGAVKLLGMMNPEDPKSLRRIYDAKRDYENKIQSYIYKPPTENPTSAEKDEIVRHQAEQKTASEESSFLFSAITSDRKLIASATLHNTIVIRDAETATPLRKLPAQEYRLRRLRFLPNTHLLYSAGGDYALKAWDADTGNLLFTRDQHTDIVTDLAISPDNQILVSCSLDRTIRFWNPLTGELLRTCTGIHDGINALAFAPDGKQLYSANSDGTIASWDVATGKLLRRFYAHHHQVITLAISADGQTLASGAENELGNFKLWDAATGNFIKTFGISYPAIRHNSPSIVGCELVGLAFSPDGHRIFAGSRQALIIFSDDPAAPAFIPPIIP